MDEFLAFMKQWAPGEQSDLFLAATGYSWAQTMTEVLRRCGDDLSRENLLKQATSLKGFHPSLFLDGINLSVTPNDRVAWRQARMARFSGASWEPFGDVITVTDNPQDQAIHARCRRASTCWGRRPVRRCCHSPEIRRQCLR
jgi:branched-chain amino acid transport system substrate-binding protein